jgi:hypothetical protein
VSCYCVTLSFPLGAFCPFFSLSLAGERHCHLSLEPSRGVRAKVTNLLVPLLKRTVGLFLKLYKGNRLNFMKSVVQGDFSSFTRGLFLFCIPKCSDK